MIILKIDADDGRFKPDNDYESARLDVAYTQSVHSASYEHDMILLQNTVAVKKKNAAPPVNIFSQTTVKALYRVAIAKTEESGVTEIMYYRKAHDAQRWSKLRRRHRFPDCLMEASVVMLLTWLVVTAQAGITLRFWKDNWKKKTEFRSVCRVEVLLLMLSSHKQTCCRCRLTRFKLCQYPKRSGFSIKNISGRPFIQ